MKSFKLIIVLSALTYSAVSYAIPLSITDATPTITVEFPTKASGTLNLETSLNLDEKIAGSTTKKPFASDNFSSAKTGIEPVVGIARANQQRKNNTVNLPEPNLFTMLILGLAGLALARKQSKSST